MAFGYDWDLGRKFVTDNLMSSEDWAIVVIAGDGNNAYLLDVSTSIMPGSCAASYDFLQSSLDDDNLLTQDMLNDDPWKDISDGSDSGTDCVALKTEPTSPTSYCSDTSSDASVYSGNSHMDIGFPDLSSTVCFTDASELSHAQWSDVTQSLMEDGELKTEVFDEFIHMDSLDVLSGTMCDGNNFVTSDAASFSPVVVNDCMSPVYVSSDSVLVHSTGAMNPVQMDNGTTVLIAPSVVTTKAITLNVPAPKTILVSNGIRNVGTGNKAQVFGQLMNSKVKIQPKVMATVKPSVPKVSSVSATPPVQNNVKSGVKTIVVSTSVPPVSDRKPVDTVKKVAIPVTNKTFTSSSPISEKSDSVDVKLIKRHQRMIKNRESACLSRKRKKEYLQSLEQQMQLYNAENNRLKTENLILKRKVESLVTENTQLKKARPMTLKSNSVRVMVVLLLFCVFNLNSVVNYFSFESFSEVNIPEGRHGRNLLSVDISESGVPEVSQSNFSQDNTAAPVIRLEEETNKPIEEDLGHKSLSKPPGARTPESLWSGIRDLIVMSQSSRDGDQTSGLEGKSMCPSYLNSTESLRLINELKGWVLGHEEERKRQQDKEQLKKPRKKYYPPRKLNAALRPSASGFVHISDKYEMQVFNSVKRDYDRFLDTLQRRNDTFYVVSFRHDHVLLPATAHNKTMRPRMSLVMPAMGLNETMQPPAGSVAMMQIDCEVTATRLIHFDKSAIPRNLFSNSSIYNENSKHQHYRESESANSSDWAHVRRP